MAKITFEAGDVISFIETTHDNSIRNKYLGVCIDSEKCVSFFCESNSGYYEDSLFFNEDDIKDIPNSALPVNIDDDVPHHWRQMFEALILVAKVTHQSKEQTKTLDTEVVNVVHESIWSGIARSAVEVKDLGRDGQDMRDSGRLKFGDFVKVAPQSEREAYTLYFVDDHGWRLIKSSK